MVKVVFQINLKNVIFEGITLEKLHSNPKKSKVGLLLHTLQQDKNPMDKIIKQKRNHKWPEKLQGNFFGNTRMENAFLSMIQSPETFKKGLEFKYTKILNVNMAKNKPNKKLPTHITED